MRKLKNPTRADKESDLCKKFFNIVRYMQAWKQFKRDFIILHVANESISSPAYGRHLLAMGMLPGAPDYLILLDNGWAAIEFKRNKSQKQTDTQIKFEERCKALNMKYLLTFSIDESLEFLRNL